MVILGETRRRKALLLRSTAVAINGLRIFWVLMVLWFELGTFIWSVARCRWPDQLLTNGHETGRPFHVLLVTDTQVPRPYKGRLPSATWLKQYVVNFNLRKSWNAVKRLRPDALIFIGDMLRHGSTSKDMQDYDEYYRQFQLIFDLDPSIPRYYVPGNRDVGLGSSQTYSPRVRDWFESYFGPVNHLVDLGNHTFILLDAPALVEEDYRRHGAQVRFAEWSGVSGGSIDFVKSLADGRPDYPVILISHIPLFRPDAALCGPLRERGNIRRGVGRGYQNILGRETSNFVLESTQPSVIFSGDDHDYCEYIHTLTAENPRDVREVTVKSFSMATRIKKPGLQLLSLASPSNFRLQPEITHADVPCFLPNQSRIYTHGYAPLIFFTMLALLFLNARRPRPPRLKGDHTWHEPVALRRNSDSSDSSPGVPSPPASPIHFKASHSQPPGLRSASTLTQNINTIPSRPATPLGGTPLLSSNFRTPTDDDGQDLLWPGRVSTPRYPPLSPRNGDHGMDSSYFLPSPGTRKIALAQKSTWLPSFSSRAQLTVRSSYMYLPFSMAGRMFGFGKRRPARTWFGRFLHDVVRVAWLPCLVYLGVSLWLFR